MEHNHTLFQCETVKSLEFAFFSPSESVQALLQIGWMLRMPTGPEQGSQ